MSQTLDSLKNTSMTRKRVQRVGRGIGSGRGKTSCRGQKGQKARSGYKRRRPQEGGATPIYQRFPTRGFTRGRFLRPFTVVNVSLIEKFFKEGEEVSIASLKEKGLVKGKNPHPLKVLGKGEITKKVKVSAHKFTKSALEKLEKAGAESNQLGS